MEGKLPSSSYELELMRCLLNPAVAVIWETLYLMEVGLYISRSIFLQAEILNDQENSESGAEINSKSLLPYWSIKALSVEQPGSPSKTSLSTMYKRPYIACGIGVGHTRDLLSTTVR